MMSSSSGTFKEGMNKQASSSYNRGPVHGEWGVPTFQHQKTISMDWSTDEQAQLEEGLAKYATESKIIQYAKIAVQLKTKTVRDVALRCRWMTKKEICKRRKEDLNTRKIKDRKEKYIDSPTNPSHLSVHSGLPQAPGMLAINDVTGPTRQLLLQNMWAFKQISANLSTHQIHENMGLLSQARENIFKIITNLDDMGPMIKKLPALPKLNEELANAILPPRNNFPIQQ